MRGEGVSGEDASGVRSPQAESAGPVDPDAIPAGTNVLIAGPALTGKRRILFEILGASDARAGAIVTTKTPAARIRSWFEAVVGPAEWSLSIVDCVSQSTSFDRRESDPGVRYVSSPGDLTGIGIGLSGVMADWHADRVVDPRVGVTSLSTLAMYADLKRLYRFCYVVTGRIRTVAGVGVFTLDTNAGSSQTIDTLVGLFDAVIDVRETDEEPELRVRGGAFGPRSWTAF